MTMRITVADTGGTRESELSLLVLDLGPREAARLLAPLADGLIVRVLDAVNQGIAQQVLEALPEDRKQAVLAAAQPESRAQWLRNESYPEGSLGRLMEPPIAVFAPGTTIAGATERIRELSRTFLVTYAFVTDEGGRLLGVVTMRELLLGRKEQTVEEIMIREPFSLRPGLDLTEAMRQVLNRHYPVYPVTDEGGRLVGIVRGQNMFEAQAIEISAQAGSMVGVDKEERLATPWPRSFRSRHPWLQLNLLTAFLAAAVVGLFQGTINRIVILAVFLPVLSGQSINTGCQSLAVSLRGLTLGELRPGRGRSLALKEALLGLLNGALVGVTAGLAMLLVAWWQGNPGAVPLAFCVFAAMTGSCVVAGVAGALIPQALRRLGADPATASSIFLTTAADVASLGLLLGFASWLVR